MRIQMIIIKLETIPNKFVAYFIAKHQIPRERLRLVPCNKSYRLVGAYASEIGKEYSCSMLLIVILAAAYSPNESYEDAFIFNWLSRGKVKKFSCKSNTESNYKIPLFRRLSRNQEVFYSFVDLALVKINNVKLSLENFTSWLGTSRLDPEYMLDWMDETRILLRFYRKNDQVEDSHKRYMYKRTNCPGDYEPSWRPKLTCYVIISKFPFSELEFTTVQPQVELQCGKPNCGFTTPRPDKLQQHRRGCRNYTLIKSKRQVYGKQQTSVDPVFKFVTFDIETVERPSAHAEANLELLSIGVASNIDGLSSRYFVRASSAHIDGQAMVDEFMDYLFSLYNAYEAFLPESLYDEYNLLEEASSFWSGPGSSQASKQNAHMRKMQIREQMMLSIYGFNSKKFDMKVLIVGFLSRRLHIL